MKRFILFLVFLQSVILAFATPVELLRRINPQDQNVSVKHPRTPALTQVYADYNNKAIGISIQNHMGVVQVLVFNKNGLIVYSTFLDIDHNGHIKVDVGGLDSGTYSINVVIGDVTYSGHFEIIYMNL